MKFNEYDVVFAEDGLRLKAIAKFNEDIDCIDKAMRFLIKRYDLENIAREKAFILSYDVSGNLSGFMQIGFGDNKGVNVSMNIICKFLLLNNAYGCIFVHNHIKGCPLEPSTDDYELHYNLISICGTLNIGVFANIILQNYTNYYNILTNKLEELT